MTLYQACIALDIWGAVKARAQVWSMSSIGNEADMLDILYAIAKTSFHKLALAHHPDKGGSTNRYLQFEGAYNKVKASRAQDFIDALQDESKVTMVTYKPGSNECRSCSRWSAIFDACITDTCSGFNLLKRTSESEVNVF